MAIDLEKYLEKYIEEEKVRLKELESKIKADLQHTHQKFEHTDVGKYVEETKSRLEKLKERARK